MDEDEREHIKNEFQAHPSKSDVRVLLATDMASEGIDLQNHCHRMVHYEIPWNPSVLEQRNGRIDRHGQEHQPLVFHFVASASDHGDGLTGDQEFLAKVVVKLEEQAKDLSGRVNEVIATQVKEGMQGRRKELEVDTRSTGNEVAGRILVSRRNIAEEVSKLREQLDESRKALHVTPPAVRRVVELGLRLAGQPALREATLDGVWPDASGATAECPVFHMPALRDGWSACTQGVLHPLTGERRPITFDHDVAKGRDDVVLAHLNHPLVQMSQRLLRAEVHVGAGHGKLGRFAVRRVPADQVEGPTAVVWGRLLVLGGDGHRLHEELISSAVRFRGGRTRRIDTVSEVQRLESLTGSPGDEADHGSARFLWETMGPQLAEALGARAATRTKNLDSIMEGRTQEEVAKVEQIFAELEKLIQGELKGRESFQLELFPTGTSDDKAQDQFERDTESLRQELATVPERMQVEVEQVRNRFADPHPRHFPVAVELLVPEGWEAR